MRGGLQRFKRVGIEKEGLKSHEGYSVSIHPRPFVGVAVDHNLAEGIGIMVYYQRMKQPIRQIPRGGDISHLRVGLCGHRGQRGRAEINDGYLKGDENEQR